jgi:hypothetical protein
MKEIYVSKKISDDKIEKKEGSFFTDDDIKIYKNDIDIYTTDGKLLLKFRKNVLSEKDCSVLYNNLKGVATLGATRPSASGIPLNGKKYKTIKSKSTGKMLRVLTTKAKSGIAGYYDTTSNFGYTRSKNLKNKSNVKCRQTAFNSKHIKKYKECLPVFQKIDKIYKKLVPKYYKIQKDAISKINKKYIIEDTIFTTVTVNNNFRTALHKDGGDLKDGFGNLVICSDGEYKGGYTMFPQYGIGVDCRNGDFLAMNVHEWHCNSKMTGSGTRISYVFYLREKMIRSCPNSKSKIKNKK